MQRATSQSDTSQLRVRIDELIRGPLAGEDSALTYAFPVGITAQDLISVQSQGGCATVNFSSNFENYYPTDTDKERLMIYSIVNTLTSEPSINRVQILVEERSRRRLRRNRPDQSADPESRYDSVQPVTPQRLPYDGEAFFFRPPPRLTKPSPGAIVKPGSMLES